MTTGLTVRALRRLQVGPVDLDLASGDCIAIRGASGAGKSVLLRMIADLDPHDGDALLDGVACSAMPATAWRRRVTYVAAESGWWLPTVGAHFAGHDAAAASLSSLGLSGDAMAWPVSRLSTGERQRLALLRAARPDTRVLLLDEPTSGLDPDNVARVEAFLATKRRDGLAIAMVTHDREQARRVAARRLLLVDGRLHDEA